MTTTDDTERRLALLERLVGDLLTKSRPNQNTSTASDVTFNTITLPGGTSSYIVTGGGNKITGIDSSVAASDTTTLGGVRGLVLVHNSTDNISQLVMIQDNAGTPVAVENTGLVMSLGTDAGSTFALYRVGADWVIKNKYATTKTMRITMITG